MVTSLFVYAEEKYEITEVNIFCYILNVLKKGGNIMPELFPETVVELAWRRSGGRCECTRVTHDHDATRCPRILTKENRGRNMIGAWEAHHINSYGSAVLSNCQILCWSCHERTF